MPILERRDQLQEDKDYKFVRQGETIAFGPSEIEHQAIARAEGLVLSKADDHGWLELFDSEVSVFGTSYDLQAPLIAPEAREKTQRLIDQLPE